MKRRNKLFGTEPPKHGTNSGYNIHGCRCDICRDARVRERQNHKEKSLGKEPPRHGLTGYETYGCRCEVCVSERKRSYLKIRANPKIIIGEREKGWIRLGIRNFNYSDFCDMYEKQNGQCAICGADVLRSGKNRSEVANVDHDHATGKVRSLLCSNCNKMLGCGRESKILRLGAEYLNRHNGDQS
jgi:hypothetical protein